MATKREGGDPVYNAADIDEPVFAFAASDCLAPGIVLGWANQLEHWSNGQPDRTSQLDPATATRAEIEKEQREMDVEWAARQKRMQARAAKARAAAADMLRWQQDSANRDKVGLPE